MIPCILPPAAVMAMVKVLNKKVLKSFWKKKVLEKGILRPATLPQVIVELIKVVRICMKIPDTLLQVIVEVLGICQV